ncbi:classical arabinogalactan protein 5-like [Syzygium oleosum]|uniref:classical arabinogalactan protein 5-like n=1 Tax=Syzygium oleosum TaxID=219896 RepID=UPI0011D28E3A|nr:classical arabinogalactan protein 5-like [Syzygium oleosum]
MAKVCLPALLVLLLVRPALAADPPQIPPALSPELAPDAPTPVAGAPEHYSPASSPPSPLPSGSPPAPAPATPSPSPSPSPSKSAGTRHTGVTVSDEDAGDGGSSSSGGDGGLSNTKKAGIVAAAIVFAGLALLGGMVYKKRKDNIRRSQYSYAARREIL